MKTRNLVFTALFIACSFVGANIKIMGSIAFDSMPAFLGALLIGPIYGAVIGAAGHLLTALTSGFPLSLPIHLIIAAAMAVTVYIFGKLQVSLLKGINKYAAMLIAIAAAVIINGPVQLFALSAILGKGILAMMPVLSAAAAANVIMAEVVYAFMPAVVKEKYRELKTWK
jgi:hypothetical protein